uniref:CSC1/OSCA1-like cytosolic domain-containing protein n=1 Tax=Corethron hystrix TaxID=216773 RepID=A0A7S1FN12_9STRA
MSLGLSRPSIRKAKLFYKTHRPSRTKVFKASDTDFQKVQQSRSGTGYRLSIPGENEIEKYRLCGSYKHFDEFGVGVSLYFRQLILLFCVLFLCSLANINSIQSNSLFNPPKADGKISFLYGSVLGASRNDLSLRRQGSSDLFTCAILLLFTLMLNRFEKKNVEEIDVSQQTPKDYTVRIKNLPRCVTTKMLHDQFNKYGDIVLISIAVGNGDLLTTLRNLREINFKIDALHEKKTYMESRNRKPGTKLKTKIKELLLAEKKLSEKARRLSEKSFPPHTAFVTFNDESSQLHCLEDMSVGGEVQRLFLKFFALLGFCGNGKSVLKGKVLTVDVPNEESEIFYENLHVSYLRRLVGKATSYFFTGTLLALSFFILQSTMKKKDDSLMKTYLASFFVSAINGALPFTLKILTHVFEISLSYGDKQVSILMKLLISRCVNTAVLLYLVTDFYNYEDMFKKKTLHQIQGILLADCFTTPLVRIMNIPDKINRHLLSRFKTTQLEMNSIFKGTSWNLSERYTDMLKTLFVGLFYSTILPSSLLITATTMVVTYWVDKFCLFRIWARIPALDESLAKISRKMIVVCVWVHIIMARIFFANWPYATRSLHKSRCNIFWCSEPMENWTYDQRSVVTVYTNIGMLVFILIMVTFGWSNFYKVFRRTWCSNFSEGEIEYKISSYCIS